jgi:hypothetical protein
VPRTLLRRVGPGKPSVLDLIEKNIGRGGQGLSRRRPEPRAKRVIVLAVTEATASGITTSARASAEGDSPRDDSVAASSSCQRVST